MKKIIFGEIILVNLLLLLELYCLGLELDSNKNIIIAILLFCNLINLVFIPLLIKTFKMLNK